MYIHRPHIYRPHIDFHKMTCLQKMAFFRLKFSNILGLMNYMVRKPNPRRGCRMRKKQKNKNILWYPAQKKPSQGRMVQTPRAGMGASMGRFY